MKISENDIRAIVSRNLRVMRHFKGLTLKDVASIVNTTHQQVQKYETGKSLIPIDKLFLLTVHFDLSINFFLKKFELSEEIAVKGD